MAKSKVVTLEQAMEKCFDGMTILLPGFVNCGVSETLIDGLMKKGVKVYMYNRGFVHSKTMVADGEFCSVGSANFDDRSLVLNFETNQLIMSKDIGKQMDDAFIEDLKYCTEYTMADYEALSWGKKLRIVISRLFGNLT